MSPTDRVRALERLLARVQERSRSPRTRIVIDGSDGVEGVSAELAAEVARDAGVGRHETVHLQELDVMEELAPDSRTESVVDLPPTEDDTPISERRPKSDLPAANVTLEDLEREAEPGSSDEQELEASFRDVPTMEQMGSIVDLPQGELSVPLELEQSGDLSLAPPPADDGDLELSIPIGEFAGSYDESLSAPEDASDDLRRLDQSAEEREAEYRRALQERPPSVPPPATPGNEPTFAVSRQAIDPSRPVATIHGARPVETKSFLELLDASLKLGR